MNASLETSDKREGIVPLSMSYNSLVRVGDCTALVMYAKTIRSFTGAMAECSSTTAEAFALMFEASVGVGCGSRSSLKSDDELRMRAVQPNPLQLGHRRLHRMHQSNPGTAGTASTCPLQVSSCTWLPLPDAPQTMYQRGVPHTDAHGQRLAAFDPSRSFLPLGLYHALTGTPAPINCAHPVRNCNYSLEILRDGNFTTAHLWEGVHADKGLADAERHGIQVIYHIQATADTLPLGERFPFVDTPVVDAVANLSKSSALLGWMLEEEPSGAYYESATVTKKMQSAFDRFLARKAAIAKVDPTHPVFALDTRWYTSPGGDCPAKGQPLLPGQLPSPTKAADCIGEWWRRWNTAGDVSCHDNYAFPSGQPFYPAVTTLGAPTTWGAIPQTVALAAAINNESKPVWVTIQAHETNLLSPLVGHMPKPREIRVQVYAAIIHGAVGIIYYAFDSWVTRVSAEVGISPDTPLSQGEDWAGHWPSNSSAELNRGSVAAWEAAVATNTELIALKAVIFAPTSTVDYAVSLMAVPGGVRCPWVRPNATTTPNDPPHNCPSSNASVTPIRTMLKGPVNGHFYLLAVNLDNTPLGAQFQLGAAAPSTAPTGVDGVFGTEFEGGRRIRSSSPGSCASGCFADSFEPFGVHVYKWPAPTLKSDDQFAATG